MPSTTVPGWEPETPTHVSVPVQFESVSGGLTGCGFADRSAALAWVHGTDVRVARQNSARQWSRDGSVASGDAGTAVSGVASGTSAAIFTVDDWPYLNVAEPARSRIYVANDKDDLAAGGWSPHGTVTTGNLAFTSPQIAAVPLILDDGTWVMVQGVNDDSLLFGSPTGFPCETWRQLSSGDGASWTQIYEGSRSLYAERFRCSQLALHPDGRINWAHQPDELTNTYYDRALPTGTPSEGFTSGDPPQPQCFICDGSDVFAIDSTGNIKKRTGPGTAYSDYTSTGFTWTGGLYASTTAYRKGIVADERTYYFADDHVLGQPPAGWHNGKAASGGGW